MNDIISNGVAAFFILMIAMGVVVLFVAVRSDD